MVVRCDSGWYAVARGGRYWAWNSFEARPYLSDREHAERFTWPDAAQRWMDKHGLTGTIRFLRDRTA